MKFTLLTFGCQMNVNDGDWLRRALLARGFEESAPEDARVFIVNTCSVRDKPEQKVYSLLGRLKELHERNPEVFVAVGGCVAQQLGTKFWGRYAFVRLVFGTDGVLMAPQAIERLCHEPDLRLSLLDFSADYPERPLFTALGGGPGQSAFVNIMQGCDNFCAYCIVPYTRGRPKSRSSAAVLAECRDLVEHGAREITLLGQNVNAYGLDDRGDGTRFAQLLRQVDALPGLRRLRFTTSHPKDLDDEVIAMFGELETLCPQLHLPLQSGSDRMLARMGRKYTLARYLDLVEGLKRTRPDIALSTDLIVGFPGETDEDFRATLAVMETADFEQSFSFCYSDRPGVAAATMTPKIEPEVKAARLEELQGVQRRLTRRAYERMVGQRVEVLLEGLSRIQRAGEDAGTPSWRGRDAHNRVVNLTPQGKTTGLAGMLVAADIMEAKKHSLLGKAAGDPW